MKKLIVLGVIVLMAIGAASLALADTDSENVAVIINVNSIFGFTVWPTELSQEYTIAPGESALGNLHIVASSNHPQLWWINASSAGAIGLFNSGVLPVQISTLSGAGLKVTDLVLTGVPQAIYTAGAGEYPKANVAVDTLFAVPTTIDTAQDVYQGTIALTMTE